MTDTWVEDAAAAVEALDTDVAAYLPDTVVAPLADAVDDSDARLVRVVREEAAVGVLSGAWIGGQRGVLICQSSGLANCFNALASLAVPARLPFLAVVTRRGDLGEFNLAQVPGGYNMPDLLDDLGVRNRVVRRAEHVRETVHMAGETAFSTRTPYVVLLDSTVTGYKEEF
jgi:sulfopyruvate decarboxylase alpha subunit